MPQVSLLGDLGLIHAQHEAPATQIPQLPSMDRNFHFGVAADAHALAFLFVIPAENLLLFLPIARCCVRASFVQTRFLA